MFKRADLEEMRWKGTNSGRVRDSENHCVARVEYYAVNEQAVSDLLAASPKLALACLRAFQFISPLASSGGSNYRAIANLLGEALAAAGVEVP